MEGRRDRLTPPDCVSAAADDRLYGEILSLREPRQGQGLANDRGLLEPRSHSGFFPRKAIRKLFTRKFLNRGRNTTWVWECLNCSCEMCAKLLGLSLSNQGIKKRSLEQMVLSDLPADESAITLLATLVYLGRSCLFPYLLSIWNGTLDDAEHKMGDRHMSIGTSSELQKAEDVLAKYKRYEDDRRSSLQTLQEDFSSAKYLFDLPIFPTHFERQRNLSPRRVLPFLHERVPSDDYSKGVNGKIIIFDIHQDYVEDSFKGEQLGGQLKPFVRKVIDAQRLSPENKSGPTNNTTHEEDNLLFVKEMKENSREKKLAIIDLFGWYFQKNQFGINEMNLVLPYYPSTLLKILRNGEEKLPKGATVPSKEELLIDNWLWRQILKIFSALVAIHNPAGVDLGSETHKISKSFIGFHFDIKPSNIVIDDEGQLLISDFGTVRFSQRETGAGSSDIPIATDGGDNNYRPPEYSEGRQQFTLHTRKYDVWSIACVIMEVITYIKGYKTDRDGLLKEYEPGAEAVREFAKDRKADSDGIFYGESWWWLTSRLKPSVKKWFQLMGSWADDPTRCNGCRDTYLKQIISLLQKYMLVPNKEDRYSSLQVQKKLDEYDAIFKEASENDPQTQRDGKQLLELDLKLRFGDDAVKTCKWSQKGSAEYYLTNGDSRTKFTPLDYFVALNYTRKSAGEPNDPRIVIATSELDLERLPQARTGSRRGQLLQNSSNKTSFENASRREEEFIPRYLYGRSPNPDDDKWKFSFKIMNPNCLYKFASDRGEEYDKLFFRFQEAILQQSILSTCSFVITHINLGGKKYTAEDRHFSLQLWIDLAFKQDPNNTHKYQSRIVLFVPRGSIDGTPSNINTMMTIRLNTGMVEVRNGLYEERNTAQKSENAIHLYVANSKRSKRPHEGFEVNIFSCVEPDMPAIPVMVHALEERERALHSGEGRVKYLNNLFKNDERDEKRASRSKRSKVKYLNIVFKDNEYDEKMGFLSDLYSRIDGVMEINLEDMVKAWNQANSGYNSPFSTPHVGSVKDMRLDSAKHTRRVL